MIWLLVLLLSLIILLVLALNPMNIPRDTGLEGPQEGDAVIAYDRTSRWPLFTFERSIILHEISRDRPQGLLIDIGCGPGFLAAAISHRFPDGTVIGLDISQAMIDIAKERWLAVAYPNLTFRIGDVQALPLADKTVDYVVSSLSLHHWQNPELAFREIYRVLKPGGRFLVFDLRRDAPHYVYYALKIGQALISPQAIRETNGAVGSFWASYTSAETDKILSSIAFKKMKVDARFAWLLIRGQVGE